MSSWVIRVAKLSRVCFNCDDHIRPGNRYFLTSAGEMFCCECPPSDAEECCEIS